MTGFVNHQVGLIALHIEKVGKMSMRQSVGNSARGNWDIVILELTISTLRCDVV